MQNREKKEGLTGVWALAMVCMAVVIFAVCAGAGYAAVEQARLSAAKASIGQIEAVLFLAEEKAEKDGMGAAPAFYSSLLKSYDDDTASRYTAYERYVLNTMLETFGTSREFDFAVTRYEDSAGSHVQVYFFPVRGRTDTRTDRYYQMKAGEVYSGG